MPLSVDGTVSGQLATESTLDGNIAVTQTVTGALTTPTGGGGGGGLPRGGVSGDIIVKRSSTDFDAYWVPPATSAEQDNTLPITAGAVYTEIGNINALLATI